MIKEPKKPSLLRQVMGWAGVALFLILTSPYILWMIVMHLLGGDKYPNMGSYHRF